MFKNFKVRLIVSLILFTIGLLSLFTLEGILFKVLFGIFVIVAEIELFSFFRKNNKKINIILVILETIFLICSVIFLARLSKTEISLLMFSVCGYDIFAYIFGSLLGGKIFKSRPFPKISKNKTWEGTILGLISSILITLLVLFIANSTEYIFIISGALAIIGDLFESYLKRTFKVKDSNEIVIKNKIFSKLELLVGGSEGHGGYLDRIDSVAFTSTILLFIFIIL